MRGNWLPRGVCAGGKTERTFESSERPCNMFCYMVNVSRKQRWKVALNTLALARRVGFRKADEVIGFLHDWQDFMVEHERPPIGFEEYAAWTRRWSRMTSYRRLKLLREAFPEVPYATPTDFLGGVVEALAAEDPERGGVVEALAAEDPER